MKKLLLILTIFTNTSLAASKIVSITDTISISIDRNTKKAIDKYDNFLYLFPYVIVFDTQNLIGKELINKHSLTNNLTIVVIVPKDDNYVLQCKTLKQEVEVVLRKGDRTSITINGDETKIKVLNRITELYEFGFDELLQKKRQDPNVAIKKYLNPLHYLSYDDAMAKGHIKEIELKKKALNDISLFTKAANTTLDSLEANRLISASTANFNRNKLNNQLLSINILESKIDFDSAKVLLKEISNSKLTYSDKYNYKLVESVANKFFVNPAKEIKFNDFTNRDYCEIFDKINESNIFETRYKNQLLERELSRIIHSFSKNIGKKYFDLFLKTVNDSLMIKNIKNKYIGLYTPINKLSELLSTENIEKSFINIASKNKYTYVDFWASWCGPCRVEMPSSKKLSDIYSSKGIDFIYVSIDENMQAWKKAANQLGLNEKNSYLLIEGNKSKLSKKYQIDSIPRYMIMDEKGDFILQNALPPSDPNIKRVFDELLKKK